MVSLFGRGILSCLILLTACGLPRSDFRLAYVTEHSLYYCACTPSLPPCSLISPADCSCKDHSFSLLLRPDSSSTVCLRRFTIWYTSPHNAARLLNNSEVRHLTLIRCSSVGVALTTSTISQGSQNYFAVQNLEKLTVSYPLLKPAHSQEVVLGKEMGAAFQTEARLGLIHFSVLLRASTMKAYTIQTHIDSQGHLPFPDLFLSKLKLSDTSNISVTFIY